MAKKQVTFADIAEYTNFSKTTISRYFNHPDSLTLENQEKISQALDALGYKKNKLAVICVFPDAGTYINHYIQVSSNGGTADCV